MRGEAFTNYTNAEQYFDGMSAVVITKQLGNSENYEVDVDKVEDVKLKSLIRDLCNSDPRKRPSITSVLLHPFFTTTGFGSWSF